MSGGIIPSQTNTNKNNYLFALAGSGGGGGVASIIAGSNVSVSGTSNVTINAVNGTTSYTNPNLVSFAIPGGASGTPVSIGFINPALYPNVNSLYRLTINYEYADATFGATPSGPITLSIFNNASPNLLLATHSVPFTANLANGDQNIGGLLTVVFRPAAAVGGGSVALGLIGLNSSGQTLTTATCVCTVFAVEEITETFTLLTTQGQCLTPPV
jgi:hypothetical protein